MSVNYGEIFNDSKVIAVVGLSPNEQKDSYKVASYLQSVGYKIIPIYPKEDKILGESVYRSLLDIKEKIDIVDVFRKSEAVGEVVDMVLQRDDVKTLWLQIGAQNEEAAKRAENRGIKVVQDECIMVEHKRFVQEQGSR